MLLFFWKEAGIALFFIRLTHTPYTFASSPLEEEKPPEENLWPFPLRSPSSSPPGCVCLFRESFTPYSLWQVGGTACGFGRGEILSFSKLSVSISILVHSSLASGCFLPFQLCTDVSIKLFITWEYPVFSGWAITFWLEALYGEVHWCFVGGLCKVRRGKMLFLYMSTSLPWEEVTGSGNHESWKCWL